MKEEEPLFRLSSNSENSEKSEQNGIFQTMQDALSKQKQQKKNQNIFIAFKKLCFDDPLFCFQWANHQNLPQTASEFMKIYEKTNELRMKYQKELNNYNSSYLESKLWKQIKQNHLHQTAQIDKHTTSVEYFIDFSLTLLKNKNTLKMAEIATIVCTIYFLKVKGCEIQMQKLLHKLHEIPKLKVVLIKLSTSTPLLSFFISENCLLKYLCSNETDFQLSLRSQQQIALEATSLNKLIDKLVNLNDQYEFNNCLLIIKLLCIKKQAPSKFNWVTRQISDPSLDGSTLKKIQEFLDMITSEPCSESKLFLILAILRAKYLPQLEAILLPTIVKLSRTDISAYLETTLNCLSTSLSEEGANDVRNLFCKFLLQVEVGELCLKDFHLIFSIVFFKFATNPLSQTQTDVVDALRNEHHNFQAEGAKSSIIQRLQKFLPVRDIQENNNDKESNNSQTVGKHLEQERKGFKTSNQTMRYLSGIDESTIIKYFRKSSSTQDISVQIKILFDRFSYSTHSSKRFNKLGLKYLSDKDWLKFCSKARIMPNVLSRTDCSWMFHQTKKLFKDRFSGLNNEVHRFTIEEFQLGVCFIYMTISGKQGVEKETFGTFLQRVLHATQSIADQHILRPRADKRINYHRSNSSLRSSINTKPPDNKKITIIIPTSGYDQNFIQDIQQRLKTYNSRGRT